MFGIIIGFHEYLIGLGSGCICIVVGYWLGKHS